MRFVLVVLALGMLLSVAARAQDVPNQKVDEIFSVYDKPGSPGCSLARIIHIFEDNKGLLCYKHVVKTMFAATKEASECLKIAQHSVCCSQEFFVSL
jgi:hypothetical protein